MLGEICLDVNPFLSWEYPRDGALPLRARPPPGARGLESVPSSPENPDCFPTTMLPPLPHQRQRSPEQVFLGGSESLALSPLFWPAPEGSNRHAQWQYASLGIQGAEAEATVGLERAHAELLSQGESLAVMHFSRLHLRGIAMGGDLAVKAQ